MFSNCPFRSLLEIVQELWFWVDIEKVMKENIRTKQNKSWKSLSKYSIVWFWVWSSLAWHRSHLGRFGLLMGYLWTSCGPRVTYRPHIRPLLAPLTPYCPKWLLFQAKEDHTQNHTIEYLLKLFQLLFCFVLMFSSITFSISTKNQSYCTISNRERNGQLENI